VLGSTRTLPTTGPCSGSAGSACKCRRRGVAQCPIDRGAAHPKHGADLLDRELSLLVHLPGLPSLLRGQLGRPTPDPATGPRRRQPSHRPVTDDLPLELGQRPEQVEYQPAASRRRVDALPQRPEPHPPRRPSRTRACRSTSWPRRGDGRSGPTGRRGRLIGGRSSMRSWSSCDRGTRWWCGAPTGWAGRCGT